MAARCFLQAKIHRATITDANVDYEGSLAVCPDLLQASGIRPFERIDVYNLDNGERLTTYALEGTRGEMCLNGAAALKGKPGQRVIVASYAWLDNDEIETHEPRIVLVDGDNVITHIVSGDEP